MINMRTVYPCKNCQAENSPYVRFCPVCGEKSSIDLNRDTIYNVVAPWRGVYSLKFGGDPILSFEDIAQAVRDQSDPRDVIVISYTAADWKNGEIYVKTWQPVVNGEIGKDEGRRKIQLTNLE